jgi:hypothetical protein
MVRADTSELNGSYLVDYIHTFIAAEALDQIKRSSVPYIQSYRIRGAPPYLFIQFGNIHKEESGIVYVMFLDIFFNSLAMFFLGDDNHPIGFGAFD